MRRAFAAGAIVVTALWAMPAAAQNAPAGPAPVEPTLNSWYLGANTGTAVVENFGGVFSAEGGLRVWKQLDIVGEIVWVQNSVTRRELDKVGTLAKSLSDSQGVPAGSGMKAPALYGGLGGRWVLEQTGKFRPYFLVTVGGAKVTLKPSLTLQGSDVTGTAAQYGVTLGQDVIGKYNHVATEGGIGVLMGFGTWYVDLGARLLSISADQRTNVARLVIGGGYRF